MNDFVKEIPNFETLKPSEMISYFFYYLSNENQNSVAPTQIKECFKTLCVPPHSNISAYLSSQNGKLFLKDKKGQYKMTRSNFKSISEKLNSKPEINASNELIDLEIFSHSRGYIEKIAEQMNACYDNALYDGCLVLMRKLIETLIIECFERYGARDEIQGANGNYFYFSDLIVQMEKSTKWSTSRNFNENISIIKNLGDLSAHNRRFLAKKTDIDPKKMSLRQICQELILTIDFPSWNMEMAKK